MPNSTLYIPPEGLAFRLIGHVSKKALVSRSSPEPVTHKSVDKRSSEQLFTLLDGACRERKGFYAIKSKATENFIYSRPSGNGNKQVWHRIGDPVYEDEWFKLDPGEGAFAGMFRLINNATIVLNGSIQQTEPELGNESKDKAHRGEQYFKFDFGEMEFLNIKYDLDDSKARASKRIHDAQLHVLDTQTLVNQTVRDQELRFEHSNADKLLHTGRWEYSRGFPIKEGTPYKTGIPMVYEGRVSMVDVSQIDKAWQFGHKMHPFAKDWKAILPAVKVPPQEKVRVTSTIMRGQLEVPFTITLRSKANGFEVCTYGIWRGTSTWDLHHTVVGGKI